MVLNRFAFRTLVLVVLIQSIVLSIDSLSTLYFQREYQDFIIWDPEFGEEMATQENVVDLEEVAKEFFPPHNIKFLLDELITEAVYLKLIEEHFDADFFKKRDFVILKDNETRVLEHANLPGYLIKISEGESRDFYLDGLFKGKKFKKMRKVKYTNLLRAPAERFFLSKIKAIAPYFCFTREYLYISPFAEISAPLNLRYFAVSQKVAIHSATETVGIIRKKTKKEQKEIARKTCQFIKTTGMLDAHPTNFLLSKEEQNFYAIDGEPLGLMIEKSDSEKNLLAFEQCALLGLIYYRDRCCRSDYKSLPMAMVVEKEIKAYLNAHPEIICHDRGMSRDYVHLSNRALSLALLKLSVGIISILFGVWVMRNFRKNTPRLFSVD